MFRKHLMATSLRTAAAAVAGSVATSVGVNSRWYEKLEKPSFQPPPAAFPVAWTLLYTDLAVTSAAVLTELPERVRPQEARRAVTGYRRALTGNLVLNAGWCWVFFVRQDPRLATVTAAALTASSADLVRRGGQAGLGKALALSPYVAWCGFATALSGRIHQLNS